MQLKHYTSAKPACLLAIVFLSVSAIAQTPVTTEFDVNGLKVILRQTQKETLVMSMYYKGGLTNYTAADAGIESLALAGIIDCGNETLSANAFDEERDEYDLHIGGEATSDYGIVKLRCITRYKEEGWKLFSSAITSPIFETKKFDLLKQEKTDDLQLSLSGADARLNRLAVETAFAGTPYANNPDGTVDNLSRLTRDTVINYYYHTLLNKKRMFLVVAGNISKEELEKKVKGAFANLPQTDYTPAPAADVTFTKNTYRIENRPLATDYVCGLLNAPTLSSPDYPAFRLGVTILNSVLYQQVRLAKRLSYAPAVYLTEGKLPYLTFYASTTQPKETVNIMYTILSASKNAPYSNQLVANLERSQMLSYLRQQESMSSIADALGAAEIMGDWRLAESFADRVSSVTSDDIQRALREYAHHFTWAYIGDEATGRAGVCAITYFSIRQFYYAVYRQWKKEIHFW